MNLTTAKQKLLDAALIWHASTILSGQRPTRADRSLHQAACKCLKAMANGRKR